MQYELRNLIRGNESFGQGNIIQTIKNHLRRSQNTSSESQTTEFTKEQETRILIDIYIQENNIFKLVFVLFFCKYKFFDYFCRNKYYKNEITNK